MENNQKVTGLPAIRKMVEAEIKLQKDDLEQNKWMLKMQRFATIMNTDVEEINLEPHPVARGRRYLPISFMEMALDQLFFGMWETVNFKWLVIANEVTASMELRVYHPYHKTWITRTGASATAIMVDKIPDDIKKNMTQVQVNEWALDQSHKKPSALEMGMFASLKAECFKNACLSLGRYFGRDVNRDHQGIFTPVVTDIQELIQKRRSQLSALISECQDTDISDAARKDALTAEDSGVATPQVYELIMNKYFPTWNQVKEF
jgi:hypothetical protein